MFIRHVFSERVVLCVFSSSAWRGEGLHGARDCTGRLDSYQSGSTRQMLVIYNVCLFTKMFGYLVSFIRLNRSLFILHLRNFTFSLFIYILSFHSLNFYLLQRSIMYLLNLILNPSTYMCTTECL